MRTKIPVMMEEAPPAVKTELQRTMNSASVDEQLYSLPSSEELLKFYRNKLEFYEREFARSTEGIASSRHPLQHDDDLRHELKKSRDEVMRLQKALSDTQVYLKQERSSVVALQSEKDKLKFEIAAEKESKKFLLDLCEIPEEKVNNMMCERKMEEGTRERKMEERTRERKKEEGKGMSSASGVDRRYESAKRYGAAKQVAKEALNKLDERLRELVLDPKMDQKTRETKENMNLVRKQIVQNAISATDDMVVNQLQTNLAVLETRLEQLDSISRTEKLKLQMKISSLEQELQESNVTGGDEGQRLKEELARLEKALNDVISHSQQETYTLHKDREALVLEMETQQKKLQDEIANLKKRLETSNQKLCETTIAYITLKHALGLREEREMLEKDGLFTQNQASTDLGQDKLGHKMKKDSKINLLKERIESKDQVIQSYKRKCEDLEREMYSLNNAGCKAISVLEHLMERDRKGKGGKTKRAAGT
ncbi:coiled-coil domain-containing protein 77-like isoform X2 [Ischnura elegans]|uniref:coiled-coil domain-containing protein 77-like isoform X2 n=1 Tax=Ischnura elegans TaxID=197161 RepID=UPI001ED878B2|nr:coiled-coil domain-containing protein 77-like isoform X2 [Ischnura elegans]